MSKITTSEGEWYPVYGFSIKSDTYEYPDAFEVDQETLDRWHAAFSTFHNVQREIDQAERAHRVALEKAAQEVQEEKDRIQWELDKPKRDALAALVRQKKLERKELHKLKHPNDKTAFTSKVT